MFVHYSFQIIYIYMNLSEPFHVTNGVRPGGVLRPYFFAVYLHDLSLEPSNIEAGYYIGEILFNHLTFVDDICVFCPSVRGLQSMLDVCLADAGLHESIFNCSKTVGMMFKAKSAKAMPSRCWHWVY